MNVYIQYKRAWMFHFDCINVHYRCVDTQLSCKIKYTTINITLYNAVRNSLFTDIPKLITVMQFHHIDIAFRVNGIYSLLWRHNGPTGVSNHQPRDCLLNRAFMRRSKKTSKLRVTGLCEGNSHKGPVTRKMFPFDDIIMFRDNTARTAYFYILWKV